MVEYACLPRHCVLRRRQGETTGCKLFQGNSDAKSQGIARARDRGDDANSHAWHPEAGISSPVRKQPGEGTGPTIHADFQGNPAGRVPSRGEQDVFEQPARRAQPAGSLSRSAFVRRPVQDDSPSPIRWGTCLAAHTPGACSCKGNCSAHGVSRVVARASRPCESCNRHTGETPVPLPSEIQTAGIQRTTHTRARGSVRVNLLQNPKLFLHGV